MVIFVLCVLTGSPFQFTVGPFGEGGAHKVHAGGPGLERGEINVPGKAVCCCLFRLVSSNCDGSPGFKIFKYI